MSRLKAASPCSDPSSVNIVNGVELSLPFKIISLLFAFALIVISPTVVFNSLAASPVAISFSFVVPPL